MKLLKHIVCTLSLLLLIAVSSNCESNDWAIQETVMLSSAEFNLDSLARKSKAILERYGKEHKWGVWYFGIDQQLLRSYPTKPVLDTTLSFWKSYASELMEDPLFTLNNIAELRLINGNAVLKAVVDGKFTRLIVAGQDPLVLKGMKFDCELLHFYFQSRCSVPVDTKSPCTCKSLNVQICLRCEVLPSSHAKNHVKALIAKMIPDCAQVELGIRTDEYFYDMVLFPTIYAFSTAKPISLQVMKSLILDETNVMLFEGKASLSRTRKK